MVDKETLIKINDLTLREIEVLSLLAKGLSNRDISEMLFISMSTVKTHTVNIGYKLGLTNCKTGPNPVQRVQETLFYIENKEEIINRYNCLKMVYEEKMENNRVALIKRK